MTQQTALIVGASRGLGLALAAEWLKRGWRVIATARGESPGLSALATHFAESIEIETADVDKAETVRSLAARLQGRRIDVVFINAGIARATDANPATADERDFLDMMLTNALAPARSAEWLAPLVPEGGVIAIMSSELGSVSRNNGFWTLYSASKAALNMLMKGFAARFASPPRALLLVAPGWVRTEMGGSAALLSIEESIPKVADMIEANRGRAGLRFVDRFDADLPW